jgi:hypothetical protein
MRYPEITKKTSTPQKPPLSAAGSVWLITTAITAMARRPSMSRRRWLPVEDIGHRRNRLTGKRYHATSRGSARNVSKLCSARTRNWIALVLVKRQATNASPLTVRGAYSAAHARCDGPHARAPSVLDAPPVRTISKTR